MKKLKKLAAVGAAVLLSMSLLTACSSGSGSEETKKATTESNGSSADKTYEIGIIQLVEHNALDAANQGFVDELTEAGYSVNFDQQNAQGNQGTCDTIATKFVADDKDLVLAIATPAAQAIASKTVDIPILVTAVTDPENAQLVDSNEAPGGNISGTSDLTPVKEQIGLIPEFLPEAKKVAIFYSSAEDNSVFQAEIAKEAITDLGLEYEVFTISNTNEIQTVVESMIGKVDCIYIPTDNALAQGMSTVAMVANKNDLPCIVGEVGMAKEGGLVTYGLDYYKLGRLTGKQAIKVLTGEADISTMAIEYISVEDCEFFVNEEAAAELGIEIPEKYKK